MVRAVLQRLRLLDDRPCAEGAVAFVLERDSSVQARNGRRLARIASTSIAWPDRPGWRGAGEALGRMLGPDPAGVRICGADSNRGRTGDRLVDRFASGIPAVAADPVERNSVQPMLQIASAITESSAGTVVARDEAGGCGSLCLHSISSS